MESKQKTEAIRRRSFFVKDPIGGFDLYLEEAVDRIRQELVPQELFSLYLTEVRKFKLLTKDEEKILAARVKERGDREARNRIVEHNLRLAVWAANFYRGGELGYLDLIQEANTGLIKAAERFDHDRGFRFTSYATWWLRAAIMKALYNTVSPIRIPQHKRQRWNQIVRVSLELAQELGREPVVEEIAMKLQLPVERIMGELEQMKAFRTYGGEAAISEEFVATPLDPGVSPTTPEELLEAKEAVRTRFKRVQSLLDQLFSLWGNTRSCWRHKTRDLEIFQMRYGLDDSSFEPKTLEEIAERFSLTKQAVAYIVERVWLELQHAGGRGREIQQFLHTLLDIQAKNDGVSLRAKGREEKRKQRECLLCGHPLSSYNLSDRCFRHWYKITHGAGLEEEPRGGRNGGFQKTMNNLSGLERRTGINFRNSQLLREALTHCSYVNEHPGLGWNHNERLEFFGDAVLESIVTEFLFMSFPGKTEGELTPIRSALVNNERLATVAKELGLNDCLLLSRAEDNTLGRSKPGILAGAFEALIGAVKLDQGYEACRKLVEKHLISRLNEVLTQMPFFNPKGRLQEETQAMGVTSTYEVIREWGPDHDRRFAAGVYVEGKLVATGEGSSKKEAEEQAAKKALQMERRLKKRS